MTLHEYEVWPHTRERLRCLRVLAITEEEQRVVDGIEASFEAEDKARWASWRVIKKADQSARRAAGGEEEPA